MSSTRTNSDSTPDSDIITLFQTAIWNMANIGNVNELEWAINGANDNVNLNWRNPRPPSDIPPGTTACGVAAVRASYFADPAKETSEYIYDNYIQCLDRLIGSGADVSIPNSAGYAPLELIQTAWDATDGRYPEIVAKRKKIVDMLQRAM